MIRIKLKIKIIYCEEIKDLASQGLGHEVLLRGDLKGRGRVLGKWGKMKTWLGRSRRDLKTLAPFTPGAFLREGKKPQVNKHRG